jgi:nucleoside-triphosphatase THEP1
MQNNNTLAARRRAAADAIVVDNCRAQIVRARVQYMIEHANNKDSGGNLGQLLTGPPQSGKSTILKSITDDLNTSEALAEGRIPSLFVTLDERVTRKQLAQNILEALENHGVYAGATQRKRDGGKTETDLLRRVRVQLKAVQCRILILDEFHHIRHADSKQVAFSVGEAIKRMLIAGVCPIIMAGLEEAARLPFDANAQLRKRCLQEITLHPLNVLEAQDSELFMGFLEDYLAELGKRGILRDPLDLLAGKTPGAMLTVTDGILGDACNFIKHAIDEATWAGRDRIAQSDLSAVVKKHFKAHANPFEAMSARGVREVRRVVEAA